MHDRLAPKGMCFGSRDLFRFCLINDISLTCLCGSVVIALGHHVQWSVTRLRSRVQSTVRARPPSTKELFQTRNVGN